MNRLQLIDILEDKNVPRSHYSTKGGKEDAVCILETDGGFELVYYEKGNKRSYGTYDDEALVCKVMLNILNVKI
ncbi:hypothetical protein AB4172_02320 [Vibrio splendidus]